MRPPAPVALQLAVASLDAVLTGGCGFSHHDDEDELFLVTKGTMLMQFRDRDVTVNPGEHPE